MAINPTSLESQIEDFLLQADLGPIEVDSLSREYTNEGAIITIMARQQHADGHGHMALMYTIKVSAELQPRRW
jgi:hypothetical protein